MEVHAVAAAAPVGQGDAGHLTFPWNEGWFTQDNTIYRHELATASMALSGAAGIHIRAISRCFFRGRMIQ